MDLHESPENSITSHGSLCPTKNKKKEEQEKERNNNFFKNVTSQV